MNLNAGRKGVGRERKVDGNTLFEIGSISKTFTSLLLLDMARTGDVNLDDPVSKFLPTNVKVPSRGGKQITLLNLAQQESGLPFNADNHVPGPGAKGFNTYRADDLYEFLSNHQLTEEPGAAFKYSNVGVTLLGHALDRCHEEDFGTLIRNRICMPLNMQSTFVTLPTSQERRLAQGHDWRGTPAKYFDLQVMQPTGGMKSTANDLLKYLSAQLGYTQTNLLPLMKRSQKIRHVQMEGFGNTAVPWCDFGVYEPPGSDFRTHGGGTPGFSTFIGMDLGKR